jgi:hypothetical protein
VNPNRRAASSIPAHRKPYTKPTLTTYGHVKDIVKMPKGSTKADTPSGVTKSCWIAEVLYGIEAPRTLLVRGWLAEAYDQRRGWWFLIGLYTTFGQTLADLIRRGCIPAQLFVPLFDYLVVKANDDTVRMLTRNRRTRT